MKKKGRYRTAYIVCYHLCLKKFVYIKIGDNKECNIYIYWLVHHRFLWKDAHIYTYREPLTLVGIRSRNQVTEAHSGWKLFITTQLYYVNY